MYYVKFDKKIVRVQDAVIENIRLLADMGSDLEVSTALFQPGEQLQIHEGPLTGLNCEVVQINGKAKILVRVKLLQRSLFATLPVRSVKQAEPVFNMPACQNPNCQKKCCHVVRN